MNASKERRLAAILAADVIGPRLMGVDEERTLAALTAHRAELIEPGISDHVGGWSRPRASVCWLSAGA